MTSKREHDDVDDDDDDYIGPMPDTASLNKKQKGIFTNTRLSFLKIIEIFIYHGFSRHKIIVIHFLRLRITFELCIFCQIFMTHKTKCKQCHIFMKIRQKAAGFISFPLN